MYEGGKIMITDKQFNNYIKEESKKYHDILLRDMRADIDGVRVYDPVPDDNMENNYIFTTELYFKHSKLVIRIDSEHSTSRDLTDEKNSVYTKDIQDMVAKNVWRDLDTILGLYYDEYRKNIIYIIN